MERAMVVNRKNVGTGKLDRGSGCDRRTNRAAAWLQALKEVREQWEKAEQGGRK